MLSNCSTSGHTSVESAATAVGHHTTHTSKPTTTSDGESEPKGASGAVSGVDAPSPAIQKNTSILTSDLSLPDNPAEHPATVIPPAALAAPGRKGRRSKIFEAGEKNTLRYVLFVYIYCISILICAPDE